jgi:hypothetical protein
MYMERLMKHADPEFCDVPVKYLVIQLIYLLLFSGATANSEIIA